MIIPVFGTFSTITVTTYGREVEGYCTAVTQESVMYPKRFAVSKAAMPFCTLLASGRFVVIIRGVRS